MQITKKVQMRQCGTRFTCIGVTVKERRGSRHRTPLFYELLCFGSALEAERYSQTPRVRIHMLHRALRLFRSCPPRVALAAFSATAAGGLDRKVTLVTVLERTAIAQCPRAAPPHTPRLFSVRCALMLAARLRSPAQHGVEIQQRKLLQLLLQLSLAEAREDTDALLVGRTAQHEQLV